MKKYLILSISLIFILSITACKSKEDPITLAARAGTYTCISGGSSMEMVIYSDGNVEIGGTSDYTKLNPQSTETTFTVQSRNGTGSFIYIIDFGNNKLIGQTSSDPKTYTISKK